MSRRVHTHCQELKPTPALKTARYTLGLGANAVASCKQKLSSVYHSEDPQVISRLSIGAPIFSGHQIHILQGLPEKGISVIGGMSVELPFRYRNPRLDMRDSAQVRTSTKFRAWRGPTLLFIFYFILFIFY